MICPVCLTVADDQGDEVASRYPSIQQTRIRTLLLGRESRYRFSARAWLGEKKASHLHLANYLFEFDSSAGTGLLLETRRSA